MAKDRPARGGPVVPGVPGSALAIRPAGVEIDYRPPCRGAWLDRGRPDKLIERSDARGVGRALAASASASGSCAPGPTGPRSPSRSARQLPGRPFDHRGGAEINGASSRPLGEAGQDRRGDPPGERAMPWAVAFGSATPSAAGAWRDSRHRPRHHRRGRRPSPRRRACRANRLRRRARRSELPLVRQRAGLPRRWPSIPSPSPVPLSLARVPRGHSPQMGARRLRTSVTSPLDAPPELP